MEHSSVFPLLGYTEKQVISDFLLRNSCAACVCRARVQRREVRGDNGLEERAGAIGDTWETRRIVLCFFYIKKKKKFS